MASHAQLRRAVRYAVDHGWESDGWGNLTRVFRPKGRVRGIRITWWTTVRPGITTILELDGTTGRRVSVRRAINVLRAEYDGDGEPAP